MYLIALEKILPLCGWLQQCSSLISSFLIFFFSFAAATTAAVNNRRKSASSHTPSFSCFPCLFFILFIFPREIYPAASFQFQRRYLLTTYPLVFFIITKIAYVTLLIKHFMRALIFPEKFYHKTFFGGSSLPLLLAKDFFFLHIAT